NQGARNDAAQAVEPADEGHREGLEPEYAERGIEAYVVRVEDARQRAGEAGQRPREREEQLEVDSALGGEQRLLAGRAHLDPERREPQEREEPEEERSRHGHREQIERRDHRATQ